MLQNADPTGEIQPDSQEMLNLEDECYMMGPLIDQQLQKIDYKHATLEDLNLKILEAFQMYNNLMKDSLTKSHSFISNPASMYATGGVGSVNGMPNSVLGNNFINQMNPSQTNSIPFVAAPPQNEAAPHLLASQLNNFASNNYTSMPVANTVGLPNYIQNYNPYQTYNLPNEHLNLNQAANSSNSNFIGAPLANSSNTLPVVNTNGFSSLPPDGSGYQQHSALAMNSSVQYGQPS